MTEKLTRTDIKRLAINGKILYTDMNISPLRYLKKLGYNSGIYGWNFDVYEYSTNILLVGYRVPSYANYIKPDEVKSFAIKLLENKLKNIDSEKIYLKENIKALTDNLGGK